MSPSPVSSSRPLPQSTDRNLASLSLSWDGPHSPVSAHEPLKGQDTLTKVARPQAPASADSSVQVAPSRSIMELGLNIGALVLGVAGAAGLVGIVSFPLVVAGAPATLPLAMLALALALLLAATAGRWRSRATARVHTADTSTGSPALASRDTRSALLSASSPAPRVPLSASPRPPEPTSYTLDDVTDVEVESRLKTLEDQYKHKPNRLSTAVHRIGLAAMPVPTIVKGRILARLDSFETCDPLELNFLMPLTSSGKEEAETRLNLLRTIWDKQDNGLIVRYCRALDIYEMPDALIAKLIDALDNNPENITRVDKLVEQVKQLRSHPGVNGLMLHEFNFLGPTGKKREPSTHHELAAQLFEAYLDADRAALYASRNLQGDLNHIFKEIEVASASKPLDVAAAAKIIRRGR